MFVSNTFYTGYRDGACVLRFTWHSLQGAECTANDTITLSTVKVYFPGSPVKEPVTVKETGRAYAKFKVMGMTCASCVNKIEKYIAGKTGTGKVLLTIRTSFTGYYRVKFWKHCLPLIPFQIRRPLNTQPLPRLHLINNKM